MNDNIIAIIVITLIYACVVNENLWVIFMG